MSKRDAINPEVANFVNNHRDVLESYPGSERETADLVRGLLRCAGESQDIETEEDGSR